LVSPGSQRLAHLPLPDVDSTLSYQWFVISDNKKHGKQPLPFQANWICIWHIEILKLSIDQSDISQLVSGCEQLEESSAQSEQLYLQGNDVRFLKIVEFCDKTW